MIDSLSLLEGLPEPGIYRWQSRIGVVDLARAIEQVGGRLAYVDGSCAQTRSEVLAELGEALGFPDYYGRNLDALVDCMREVGVPGVHTVLLWDGWSRLARADPPGFAAIIDIMHERAVEAERPAYTVVLRGDGPELDPPLPVLP